jgi:hypothetical protein
VIEPLDVQGDSLARFRRLQDDAVGVLPGILEDVAEAHDVVADNRVVAQRGGETIADR